MDSWWSKVDPDSAVDQLPQPYRSINKIIEEILRGVGEEITTIEERRKSEAYEVGLPQARPVASVQVQDIVTCACVEPKRRQRLAAGTSAGEVVILDARHHQVLARERVFPDQAVRCIELCKDGLYEVPPPPATVAAELPVRGPPRAFMKAFLTGVTHPRVYVYDVCKDLRSKGGKDKFGGLVTLRPACAIHLPQVAPSGAAGQPPAAVEQLHVRGTLGGFWVLALLADRSVRAFLCPLGPPEEEGEEGAVCDPILESEEEQEMAEEGGKLLAQPRAAAAAAKPGEPPQRSASPAAPAKGGAGDPKKKKPAGGGKEAASEPGEVQALQVFANAVQVTTPIYTFVLPATVPARPPAAAAATLPQLTLAMARPLQDGALRNLAGAVTCRVPLRCFVSEASSSSFEVYTLRAPEPPLAKWSGGVPLQQFLTQAAPKPGELPEPGKAEVLAPHRRWTLPSAVTAVAASPNGALVAVGCQSGALSLVTVGRGPSMRTTLPGHYAPVLAMSFYKAEVLVSTGKDCWVHFYCTKKDNLLGRFLCAPPPSPPPAVTVALSQTMPLALTLDEGRGMRLLDLRRCKKIARLVCQEEEELRSPMAGSMGGGWGAEEVKLLGPEQQPGRVLACAGGFCVIFTDKAPDPSAGEAGASAPERLSYLVFFDQVQVLCKLFPGLAARAGDQEDRRLLEQLFTSFSPQELLVVPQNISTSDTGLHGGVSSELGSVTRLICPPPVATIRLPKTAAAAQSFPTLTADNLQQIEKKGLHQHRHPQQQQSGAGQRHNNSHHHESTSFSAALLQSGMSLMSRTEQFTQAGSASFEPGMHTLRAVQEEGRHAVPRPWQATVRRGLRAKVGEKDRRLHRINKRMEQLQQALSGGGGAPAGS